MAQGGVDHRSPYSILGYQNGLSKIQGRRSSMPTARYIFRRDNLVGPTLRYRTTVHNVPGFISRVSRTARRLTPPYQLLTSEQVAYTIYVTLGTITSKKQKRRVLFLRHDTTARRNELGLGNELIIGVGGFKREGSSEMIGMESIRTLSLDFDMKVSGSRTDGVGRRMHVRGRY